MKLFVTGATGFVGSHFSKYCLDNNSDVVLLKRSPESSPRISTLDTNIFLCKSYKTLNKFDFEGVDVLLHLACHSANYPYDSIENCLKYNVHQPLELFKLAKSSGVSKFVVIGTCFEYGISGKYYDYIPANAPLFPTLTYPSSKAAGAIVFTQWAIQNAVSLAYLRLFQVYGPGEKSSRLWPSLVHAAKTGTDFRMTRGEQLRDFSRVEDIAEDIYWHCRSMMESQSRVFHQNLGSGEALSVASFAKRIWEENNATGNLEIGALPYRLLEVARFVPDLTPFEIC
tara:strand:- start:3549 stop:4400 length:852 start_codon:yes stop_codon:yes gene_type:complete